jgi:hypothetical protein
MYFVPEKTKSTFLFLLSTSDHQLILYGNSAKVGSLAELQPPCPCIKGLAGRLDFLQLARH